ncbi:hypothetical protein HRS9139_10562 [Pyrenophora teres f. teres]|uniref:Uncharacterized protein n=1 Tax=Pyrenophora teres f. teres TaxID=97479 RepID=A0A6S6WHD2_9PLEO|nr:hypothetical protein HRS9139_10562 [Pyrenophora teres f. teres]CAE7221186.1 hypothetical protein PTTW11_11391 [Pyrenophora teres f. teres]
MPRGRPRKYQTKEEAAEAARQLRQQRYQRQRWAQAPPEFIAYAPTIPGAPTTTYLDIGLRISADVPIPRDAFTLPDEPLEGEDEYRQPSPLASLAVAEVEAAAVISQLRASDREQTNESIEYEQRILQQIQDSDARAARILLEIQARTAQNTSANGILEHSGNVERPAGLENDKASDSPQTPSQRSVSSAQLSGRRKTFPVQSNTLLSWVKRVPRQSSKGSQAPQPAQLIPSHSTPLPLPPSSTSSTPRLPQLSNSNSIPQLAAQEAPAAASPSPFIRPSNMPSPAAARAASQARSTSRASSPPILPTERTAYKLAKQLRNFQGCTHEEHTEADRRHEEHHQRPDVYSTCSSFKEITRLLRGVHNGGTPLPNVLSNPKLMEPSALPKEVDLKAAFEGTSPRAFPKD